MAAYQVDRGFAALWRRDTQDHAWCVPSSGSNRALNEVDNPQNLKLTIRSIFVP